VRSAGHRDGHRNLSGRRATGETGVFFVVQVVVFFAGGAALVSCCSGCHRQVSFFAGHLGSSILLGHVYSFYLFCIVLVSVLVAHGFLAVGDGAVCAHVCA
jgi:hypothetical protein